MQQRSATTPCFQPHLQHINAYCDIQMLTSPQHNGDVSQQHMISYILMVDIIIFNKNVKAPYVWDKPGHRRIRDIHAIITIINI